MCHPTTAAILLVSNLRTICFNALLHAGGELVCAGAVDTFEIFVWSLKTGRLLERLAGHEGPVCCLGFSPAAGKAKICAMGY